MTNRLPLTAILAGALAMGVPAFAQDQQTADQTETETGTAEDAVADVSADTVVARIGDTEITLGHVIAVRQQLPEQYQQLPDEALFSGIVDQLIDQYLLAEELAELPADVALRMENEQRAIKAQEVIEQLVAEEIPDDALQTAYDETYGDVEPTTEYNASHILLETEEDAQAVVEELEGGADFAELAKEKSTGPSGPQGGELGWFGTGAMVPEFEEAVISLEAGTFSAPVQTQFGWHVVRLNETREVPPPSLEETRDELGEIILQKRVQDKIEALRESAGAEVLTDGIPAAAFRDDSILSE